MAAQPEGGLRWRERQLHLVTCGDGTSLIPLGEGRERRLGHARTAIEMLTASSMGPALSRGLERARGLVLWAHRRWAIDVVMVANEPPDEDTRWQLQRARGDDVRVVTACPPPDEGWQPCWGEHIPVRPGAGELTGAIRDVPGRLGELRGDQYVPEWTKHGIAAMQATRWRVRYA